MAPNPALPAHSYMFIGLFISVWLYGIMTTQVYLYYKNYPKDSRWLHSLVAVLAIADSLNVVFLLVYLYQSLIIHYNDPHFLQIPGWVFATDPALTGVIAALVQYFFAWRIKVLIGSYLLFCALATLSTLGLATSIATAVAVTRSTSFETFRMFKLVVIIWLVSAVVVDLTITAILVRYLKTHKTGFPASDQLVDKIIRMTIQTGLTTSICASLDLLFYLLFPTGQHLIFNFVLSKLYSNSLMSTLNSRKGWRFSASSAGPAGPSGFSMDVTDASTTQDASALPSMQFARPVEIYTVSESHEFRDADPSPNRGHHYATTSPTHPAIIYSGCMKRRVSQVPSPSGTDSVHGHSVGSNEHQGGTRVSVAETLVDHRLSVV